jgi:hypothetical protein
MPNGFLSKTPAEVALELVRSYLEFADEKEKAAYKSADEYFGLYQKAFALIVQVEEEARKEKAKAGF